jgi:hypothetical protein
MLNTILYNQDEEIEGEVNKSQRKALASSAVATTITSSMTRPSNRDTVVANNDALFDRKIELISEGIDSFFKSDLRELSHDNALTIVYHVLSHGLIVQGLLKDTCIIAYWTISFNTHPK